MLQDRDYMRPPQPSRWFAALRPDAVTLIIITNVVVFICQHWLLIGADRYNKDIIIPWGALSVQTLQEGHFWTLFTHMFVHQSVFHILGNCMMIFFAGKGLQSLLGPRNFLYIYFLSGLSGAALELIVGWVANAMYPMIGASAAAFGIFMALAVMLPNEQITAMIYFIIPVQMRLWNLARILVAVSLAMGLLQIFRIWNLQIANFAHLGGAMAGWWFVRLLGYGGTPVTYERLWHERLEREQRRELAGVTRRQHDREGKVVVVKESPLPVHSAKDFIAQQVDPILDKIVLRGISSLTEEEYNLLEQAKTMLEEEDSKELNKR